MTPAVFIIGTRPEAIKVIPVYLAFQQAGIPSLICFTGQHNDLVDDIFTIFGVTPDIELGIMKPGQTLSHITEEVLRQTQQHFQEIKPSMVVVQGDTTSALAAALAAFYCKIPVGHIEAGLRTHDIYAPYPEEANRQIISRIAAFHFAPTEKSAANLRSEGISADKIFVTGNTIVDALNAIVEKLDQGVTKPSEEVRQTIDRLHAEGKFTFLLTAHRRESFDGGLHTILRTIKDYLESHPDVVVLFPVHPNPAIATTIRDVFGDDTDRLLRFPPLPYHDLVYLLSRVGAVLTDSGGIQEEAVSLGRPTLVLRNETDRPEAIERRLALLVGTDPTKITEGMDEFLARATAPETSERHSVYGDGRASQRIAAIVRRDMPEQKKRVLLGAPIRQRPEILSEFVLSLEELEQISFSFDYYFIDDNTDSDSSQILRDFQARHGARCHIATPEESQEAFYDSANEITHSWSNETVWKVARFKDEMIARAVNLGYDHLFLVDSDLILHPHTVEQLIAAEKGIVFNIYWTAWQPGTLEMPQVWLQDEYNFFDKNENPDISHEEQLAAYPKVAEMLRVPGLYEVGGGGACTLIDRESLVKGVSFKRIPNISFWGEDRHFCVRAVALGVNLYVDTHYPAYHIYRPSDIQGIAAYKERKIDSPPAEAVSLPAPDPSSPVAEVSPP